MANVLGALFGDIAAAIREKTGDTATMKPAEFPEKINAIQVGGSSGGGGALPAGLYFEPLDLRKPNDYSQAWCMLNGTRYVFSNASSGNGSLGNVYKMDDNANTHTQIVSGQATVLNFPNAGMLRYTEFNGKIYISGGESKNYAIFDGNTLTRKTDLPNLAMDGFFVHNNTLKTYSFYDGTVYALDETSNTWKAETKAFSGSYKYCNIYVVNGIPYFIQNTDVYTYDGSAMTNVGSCTYQGIYGCVIGDCIYYGVSQSNKPYAMCKYDTTTNQETMLGVIAPGYSNYSRFWEYDGKLAFLSCDNNANYAVTNMIVHIIEATE